MMSIRTNMAALFAHRYAGIHQKTVAKALQRISSGYRINSAADDAAGLAISEKMRGQIRGMQMALRNTQNSISMLQTAEGGLNETHAMLQRMRELAVQASNGTMSEHDRKLLDIEYQALKSEITRVSDSTHYNSIHLLNGSSGGKQGEEGLQRLGITGDIEAAGNYQGDAKLLIQRLDDGKVRLVLQTGDQNHVQTISGSSVQDVDFTLDDGTTITFKDIVADDLKDGVVANLKIRDSAVSCDKSLSALSQSDEVVFQIGANGGADQRLGVSIGDMSAGSLGRGGNTLLSETSIATRDDANKAIDILESSIKQVSSQRAQIGAQINRLGHTINNLENSILNLSDAESRIRDADIAEEMMNYTKANILLQAAQAMMAQAMQQPHLILQMLNSL